MSVSILVEVSVSQLSDYKLYLYKGNDLALIKPAKDLSSTKNHLIIPLIPKLYKLF
jgi:hypothetical protein